MQNVVIIGRRWFEKTYGNTYHSVRVWVDGEFVSSEPFVYGYGDQYIQTGIDLLIKHGHLAPSPVDQPDDYWPFSLWCRENDIQLVCNVSDVGRKRDL